MARSLSITVHPADVGAEYLTVSDAMQQVLDLVEALERAEDVERGARQIVWRLTEAHTNSPPFTVTAEAYSADPAVSVSLHASRVTALFSSGLRELLDGQSPDWMEPETGAPLKKAMKRNLNGVGRTEIRIQDEEPIHVLPVNAKNAVLALERLELNAEAAEPDYRRTEYGAAEVEIYGLGRWNEKPALLALERLSRDKLNCVLTHDLAEELGPTHKWMEAWEGKRLLITGALHYGADGSLKRIDAEIVEELPWTDVSLADLRDIDILQGRSVSEHLRLLRGGESA